MSPFVWKLQLVDISGWSSACQQVASGRARGRGGNLKNTVKVFVVPTFVDNVRTTFYGSDDKSAV